MLNPVATYRLQFHKQFTFQDLERMLPYLHKLGVRTIYASPIFEATPGSNHGYDTLNPHRINPEIGTEEQLQAISSRLKELGMYWIQDIVPNHMAFDMRNPWLRDVLEKGRKSAYAAFFDVVWNTPLPDENVMVPFLGSSLEESIRNGELQVAYLNERLVLRYYESAYPLNLSAYKAVLHALQATADNDVKQVQQLISRTQQSRDAERYHQLFEKTILQFAALMQQEDKRSLMERHIEKINKDKRRLQQLLDAQAYRLCHWQETDQNINYRRFFTVNGLICLNIQEPHVFAHFHRYIHTLLNEGVFHGLRVDHIDGLYDPTQYLQQLRQLAGDETYLVVEKILAPQETLPGQWPVQGNTGYDFLAIVNNLLTNSAAKKAFTQYYYGLISDYRTVPQQIRDAKAYMLYRHMGGELENLYQLFKTLDLIDPLRFESLEEGTLKQAIGEFLVHCPVYRYYGKQLPLAQEEATAVQHILSIIHQTEPGLQQAVAVLGDVFLKNPYAGNDDYNTRALHFYQRCMQFSGPLMAKGVEDTVMYTFNRFIGHNEVGDAPESFGFSMASFHEQMKKRQQDWPLSINATATHDTKRGEDFRARLHVLTDIPQIWLETVDHWRALNADLKEAGAPDVNDEYFIYQTLIGSYPLQEDEHVHYKERLQEYLQKALREAKRHSNWTSPNKAYETATKAFAVNLLDAHRPFWESFQKLFHKVVSFGVINSLVQVVLKFMCPGVPDVYQGCERWDFSFVDPDNRRPVDYNALSDSLNALTSQKPDTSLLQQLWQQRTNAGIKTWLVHTLLKLRNDHADLFADGDYMPLKAEGTYKEHILAFARKYQQTWCIVIAPLHLAALQQGSPEAIETFDWKDTLVRLPKAVKEDWHDVLRGNSGKQEKGILIKDVFRFVPLAILKMQGEEQERSAGILMHITSLPSRFGIGDLGPQAKAFADFLFRSRQQYWQVLPINPTEGSQGHSPYSSISSRAGNSLLISPEMLVQEGLLSKNEIEHYVLPNEGKTDYEMAERIKQELFQKAWGAYCSGKDASLHSSFEQFKNDEQEWLTDFALYTVLKKIHNGKPWYQWPEAYKSRTSEVLKQFAATHQDEMEKAQWLQFLFSRQWHAFKGYCNSRNIKLLGDLPIYVSYDSVDVWANKKVFRLDEAGNRLGLAGVPPDAFSEDGQLWGMPVYNWDYLKEHRYGWWVERLRKNQELFDAIRLDHFRAFADYWEVPAGETTAKNGVWKPGPGADFFESIRQQLGDLPFIAEDLGEINDAVLELRDDFCLPGMKILQFAFGEEVATSDYIPHNYTPNFIAYTGTHDNNTTRGWYRQEASEETRHRVQQYMARHLTEENVAYFMCRMAHASVAKLAILPVQDLLSLDESARMNTPASEKNNWRWRLLPGQLTKEIERQLREWTIMYNRG